MYIDIVINTAYMLLSLYLPSQDISLTDISLCICEISNTFLNFTAEMMPLWCVAQERPPHLLPDHCHSMSNVKFYCESWRLWFTLELLLFAGTSWPVCLQKWSVIVIDHWSACTMIKQELSYRKQIVRQLHTQYVKGICNNPWPWNLGQGSLKVTGNGTIG